MKIELKRCTEENGFYVLEVYETWWRLFRTPGQRVSVYIKGKDLNWYNQGWQTVSYTLGTRLNELLQQHLFQSRERS